MKSFNAKQKKETQKFLKKSEKVMYTALTGKKRRKKSALEKVIDSLNKMAK